MATKNMCLDCDEAECDLDGAGRCWHCAGKAALLARVEALEGALREYQRLADGGLIAPARMADDDDYSWRCLRDAREAARALLASTAGREAP